jgi:DNA-binding transcriptional MerR regulator
MMVRLHISVPAHEANYDMEALARLAGVHPALVTQYVRLGLIDPVERGVDGGLRFDDSALHALRRIQRLRSELGINLNGVGAILELLQQIEELQKELARLREE